MEGFLVVFDSIVATRPTGQTFLGSESAIIASAARRRASVRLSQPAPKVGNSANDL
jgi:hypothetical protein